MIYNLSELSPPRHLLEEEKHQAPFLRCFLNRVLRERGRQFRKAVIVCPGGSYAALSAREADEVALRFQAYGCQSFVLNYSVAGKPYPTALLEAAAAVAAVRKNASVWDIDPDKIVLCGFSAGGHLAASLSVHWDKPILREPYPEGLCRPNGIILCYPIITAQKPDREQVFMRELCVDENSPWFSWLSVEEHVTENTPPCFLWHNADDSTVPVTNSILWLQALAQYNVPFEAHIFPTGGHGLSLADETTASTEKNINEICAQWSALAIHWLQRL